MIDTEPGTALAVQPTFEPETGLAYYVPSREHIGQSLSLAKVLFETRGATIPTSIKTVQEAAAIILAGEALGYDPMTSFRRIYTVNGRTQPDAQAMAGLIQNAGGDLVYHEVTAEAADVELIRPGRPSIRVRYTIEQAKRANLTSKDAWKAHPEDMLVWKAVARCARRGAADIINRVGVAMVEVAHFEDASRQQSTEAATDAIWQEEPAALPDNGETECHESQSADAGITPSSTTSPEPSGAASVATAMTTSPTSAETGRIPANGPSRPEDAWRLVSYAEAQADKSAFFRELSTFQKAIKGLGTLPEAAKDMTLGEIVDALSGAA